MKDVITYRTDLIRLRGNNRERLNEKKETKQEFSSEKFEKLISFAKQNGYQDPSEQLRIENERLKNELNQSNKKREEIENNFKMLKQDLQKQNFGVVESPVDKNGSITVISDQKTTDNTFTSPKSFETKKSSKFASYYSSLYSPGEIFFSLEERILHLEKKYSELNKKKNFYLSALKEKEKEIDNLKNKLK